MSYREIWNTAPGSRSPRAGAPSRAAAPTPTDLECCTPPEEEDGEEEGEEEEGEEEDGEEGEEDGEDNSEDNSE